MNARVVIAKVIGLAVAAAIGVGSYGTGCEPTETCHVASGVVIFAFTVGIPLAMIAIVAGGGLLVMGAVFAAIGVGSIAAGVTGDDLFGWVFGGIFVLVGVGIFALDRYVRRVALRPGAPMGPRMRAALEGTQNRLVGPGQPAVGTVLSVTDTGATLNDNPLANLRLRVEPADGSAPFEAVATKLVSRLAVPRPGDRFSVEYDPADRTRLAVRRALPVEPRQTSMVDQLAKLDELRRSGALTQPEFDSAKAQLLRQGDSV